MVSKTKKGKGGSAELLVPAILLAAQGAYRKVLDAEKKGGAKKRGRKHGGAESMVTLPLEEYDKLKLLEAECKELQRAADDEAPEEIPEPVGTEPSEQPVGTERQDGSQTLGGKKKGKKSRGGNPFPNMGAALESLESTFLNHGGGKKKKTKKRHGGDCVGADLETAYDTMETVPAPQEGGAKKKRGRKHGGSDASVVGADLNEAFQTLAMEGGKGKKKKTRKLGGSAEEVMDDAPEPFSPLPAGSEIAMEGGKGKKKKSRKHGGSAEDTMNEQLSETFGGIASPVEGGMEGGKGKKKHRKTKRGGAVSIAEGFGPMLQEQPSDIVSPPNAAPDSDSLEQLGGKKKKKATKRGGNAGMPLEEFSQPLAAPEGSAQTGGKKKRGSRKLSGGALLDLYHAQLGSLQSQLAGMMKN